MALVDANCVGDFQIGFANGEGEFEVKVHSSGCLLIGTVITEKC